MQRLTVLWEDEDILVLDKQAGISVTRSETEKGETLQDLLMDYFNLSNLGIGGRAGIVHRLDKETSGCLLVAKSRRAFDKLTRQFFEREVEKTYLTLAHGTTKEAHFLAALPLGRHPKKRHQFAVLPFGRPGETKFELQKPLTFQREKFGDLLKKFPKSRQKFLENNAHDYSLVEAKPKTGRTHQIRLHLKFLGHPVVADPLYSGKFYDFDRLFCSRMFLHARALGFTHPKTQEKMTIKSPLPSELEEALSYLR